MDVKELAIRLIVWAIVMAGLWYFECPTDLIILTAIGTLLGVFLYGWAPSEK